VGGGPAGRPSEPARLHGGDANPAGHADTVAGVPDRLAAAAEVTTEAGGRERAPFAARGDG
jgi:hypothetical protein